MNAGDLVHMAQVHETDLSSNIAVLSTDSMIEERKSEDQTQQNRPPAESMVSSSTSQQEDEPIEPRHMNVKATDRDFGDVIRELGPDGLQELFLELNIKHTDIEKEEINAGLPHPDRKARMVLNFWRRRNASQATCQALLDALEKCGNIEAKEILEDMWNGNDIQITPDTELYDKVQDLNIDHLNRVYKELGISENDVKKVEVKENTKDIDRKTKAVLRFWKKRKGKKANVGELDRAIQRSHQQGRNVQKTKDPSSTEEPQVSDRPSPVTLTGQPIIEIPFDDNNADTAVKVVEAIIAILNSSSGGIIKLIRQFIGAKSPSLSFTKSLEQRMVDLDLIQPNDLILPSFDFTSHDEQNIIIHPTKRKILHFFKEETDLWKNKWGIAYTKSAGSLKRITNTDSLLRVFGQDNRNFAIPDLPKMPSVHKITEDAQLNLTEETNAVYFTELNDSNLETSTKEILKVVGAFANTVGGLLALGVTDNGIVKGINFQQFNVDTLHDFIWKKIRQDLIWIKMNKKKLVLLTKSDVESRLKYKAYNVKPNSTATEPTKPRKEIVFITVPKLNNGVVLTSSPKCPYFDQYFQKVMYTDETSLKTWCDLASTCLQIRFPNVSQ